MQTHCQKNTNPKLSDTKAAIKPMNGSSYIGSAEIIKAEGSYYVLTTGHILHNMKSPETNAEKIAKYAISDVYECNSMQLGGGTFLDGAFMIPLWVWNTEFKDHGFLTDNVYLSDEEIHGFYNANEDSEDGIFQHQLSFDNISYFGSLSGYNEGRSVIYSPYQGDSGAGLKVSFSNGIKKLFGIIQGGSIGSGRMLYFWNIEYNPYGQNSSLYSRLRADFSALSERKGDLEITTFSTPVFPCRVLYSK